MITDDIQDLMDVGSLFDRADVIEHGDHIPLGHLHNIICFAEILLFDYPGGPLRGCKDDSQLVDVGLLPSEVSTVTVRDEVLGAEIYVVMVRVPASAPVPGEWG